MFFHFHNFDKVAESWFKGNGSWKIVFDEFPVKITHLSFMAYSPQNGGYLMKSGDLKRRVSAF